MASSAMQFIADEEGFSKTAYPDPPGSGKWSVGYGNQRHLDGSPVKQGDTITEADAKKLLAKEVAYFEAAVDRWAKKYNYKLTNNQRIALTSFAYNLGEGALEQVSDSGKRTLQEIGQMIPKYNKSAGQTSPGLIKRRDREQTLFNSGANETPVETPDEEPATKPEQTKPTRKVTEDDVFKIVTVNNRDYTVTYGGKIIRDDGKVMKRTGGLSKHILREAGWHKDVLKEANKGGDEDRLSEAQRVIDNESWVEIGRLVSVGELTVEEVADALLMDPILVQAIIDKDVAKTAEYLQYEKDEWVVIDTNGKKTPIIDVLSTLVGWLKEFADTLKDTITQDRFEEVDTGHYTVKNISGSSVQFWRQQEVGTWEELNVETGQWEQRPYHRKQMNAAVNDGRAVPAEPGSTEWLEGIKAVKAKNSSEP